MNKILEKVANVIRHNAMVGAGAASIRGTYEAPVPAVLKQSK